MAKVPGIQMRHVDPSDLVWSYPAAALRMLDGFEHLLGIDRRTRAMPIPDDQLSRTLGRLLRDLLPDGTTAHLAETGMELAKKDRERLAFLVRASRGELETRQATTPSIPLGFLPTPREQWAALLSRGWIVPPPEWQMCLRE